MKKLFLLILTILIVSISIVPTFATVGTYEYNDYNLYSTNNTRYSSGALRSNTASMATYALTVNVNNNTWKITGGSFTAIPFPSGVAIQFTDRATFLQNAYVMVNNTRYNFSFVSGNDTSGEYFVSNIPTSGWPVVNIYLPTTGQSDVVPTTPILSVNTNTGTYRQNLEWTPTGYSTRIWYYATENTAQPEIISEVATSPWQNTYATGWYRVQLHYSVDGVDYLTDTSNKVYSELQTDPDPGDDDEESDWQKFLRLLDNIIVGLDNALSTLGRFITTLRTFITSLFSWLPEEISAVLIAVMVVGLVIGLFLK